MRKGPRAGLRARSVPGILSGMIACRIRAAAVSRVFGIVLCAVILLWLSPSPASEGAARDLIRRAGNAEDEGTRLRLLRDLAAKAPADARWRGELDALLPLVESWADDRARAAAAVDSGRAAENGYLCWFISSKVKPRAEGPMVPPEPAADSPLHPLWALYRGRMLIWRVVQVGPLRRVPERRDAYYGEARGLLEEARAAFPENRVIRMYLGEPIPWPSPFAPDPVAPEWANLQREGLEKLADVIGWWAEARQLEDGQFGGGWGDDVEMWRWWTPILIGFQDPVAEAAQERISNGIFRQPHLAAGFTSRVTDVEHSNEDTTDTILPMLHLKPDDPIWRARAMRLAELMRDRWTGRNERGFLHFRSIYFSADKVDDSPGRAFDTAYHASIVQPALLCWQRTGDAGLGALFGDWLKGWVDAAAREDNGKPAGVLPSTIRWPDGGVGFPDRPWWEPFPLSHNDALYNWPGASGLMTSTLLLAFHMTGDKSYLEPIRSMAAIRARHRRDPGEPKGSAPWCARQMRGFLSDALAKYRTLTGDTQFDELLAADASGYMKFRLGGDARGLIADLRRNAEAFRSNREAFTSEMRWTDRVIGFTSYYLECLDRPAPPSPSPAVLYASATGDPGTPLLFPMNAARWLTPPREIAALVTDTGPTAFAADLFHFGKSPRDMAAEIYLLRPGEYALTLAPKDGGPPCSRQTVRVSGPRTRVAFELPPGELVSLSLRPAAR